MWSLIHLYSPATLTGTPAHSCSYPISAQTDPDQTSALEQDVI